MVENVLDARRGTIFSKVDCASNKKHVLNLINSAFNVQSSLPLRWSMLSDRVLRAVTSGNVCSLCFRVLDKKKNNY